MIPVTKTFFPPIENYTLQTQRIWKNEWLTNRGELVIELEDKLKRHLNVPNLILTTNGTLPLQIALKKMAVEGEVITTPFSYVATSAAIIWENCTPIFVDIHPDFLTIDESKIEAAISPKTTAILATHVFGNPCNVEAIEILAKKYDLKVIYDGAHCFGVNYNGKSIFSYGDVSTCSFHATKLFHTGEGGALICADEELNHQLYYSHNFGHNGPLDFFGLGINAKMSELQAAMGLCVLDELPKIINARKAVVELYDSHLNFGNLKKIEIRGGTSWNYSYYPIIFKSEEKLLEVQQKLNEREIYPRRYFYPSLNKLNYVKDINMPISEDISSKILCLPLYWGLRDKDQQKVIETINSAL